MKIRQVVHKDCEADDTFIEIVNSIGNIEIDDDDASTEERFYDRSITFDLPIECSIYVGVQSITVSFRDLLSWYSQSGPVEDRALATRIRDFSYSGDEVGDYETGFMYVPLCSREERALARWKLEQDQAERTRKRAELDASQQEYEAEQDRRWNPFLAEKAAVDAKLKVLWDRGDDLDQEWYELICKSKADKGISEVWINQRRAELLARTDQLRVELKEIGEVDDLLSEKSIMAM